MGMGNLPSAATTSGDEFHPSPFDDCLGDIFESKHVCCFHSVEELHRWFDRLNPTEHDEGVIAFYKVPDNEYHKGKYQSIATAGLMELIEEQPVTFGK